MLLSASLLSEVTYEAALNWIRASGIESQRLDFKVDWTQARDMAASCCAFANAYGGVLVIGFRDPSKTNGKIVPRDSPLDLTDSRIMSILNALLALIAPKIPVEIWPFCPPEDQVGPTFAVVRVQPSLLAPHEVLTDHQFYVRRDRTTSKLSLLEIEALIARRDKRRIERLPNDDPQFPEIPFGAIFGGPSHVAVTIHPLENHLADVEHSRTDDDHIRLDVKNMRCAADDVKFMPTENGLLCLVGPSEPAERNEVKLGIEIRGTGEITVRQLIGYRMGLLSDVDDLIDAAAIAFYLAARYYRRNSFGSAAQCRLIVANEHGNARPVQTLATSSNSSIKIDLSLPFEVALSRLVERVWRAAGSNPDVQSLVSYLSARWLDGFAHAHSASPWFES